MNRLHILTGPPGSGKTAILEGLRERGFCSVDEYARRVIVRERETGGRGTSEQDPALFVELMLACALDDYQQHRDSSDTVVFDRGIPDLIAYAEGSGFDTAQVRDACRRFRYNRTVLYAPAWEEIYTQDEERRATYEQIVKFGERNKRAYEETGYRLVYIPKAPLDERIDFVLQRI